MSWWRAFVLLMGGVGVGVMTTHGFECVDGSRLAGMMGSCFYLGVLVIQSSRNVNGETSTGVED